MKRKLNEHDVPETINGSAESQISAEAAPTFASRGLDTRLLQAVNRQKFPAPTSVQRQAIPVILDGKDVLARAKTGSGKTLAYLLPILHTILKRKASSDSNKHTSALILVPTKELAIQVASTIKTFTSACAQDVRYENITRKEDAAVTRTRLAEKPDIVISTPSRASHWVNSEALKLDELKQLVIDEADLVLSYGYEDDLKSLSSAVPSGVQTILISATLRAEIDTLTSILGRAKSTPPTVLDLSAEEAAEKSQLSHYVVRTAEEEKFLLVYAIFKLKLIKGKVIIFVADIDRAYRVRLFLEQFGIRSCVLNSELPVNSRMHVVEEFNRGVYEIIIAADEAVMEEGQRRKKRKMDAAGDAGADREDAEGMAEENDTTEAAPAKAKKGAMGHQNRDDVEYTVSRGVDFRHVACVLNFDLPTSSKSYTHRTGRTARAGQTGMALSFYVPKEFYRKHKPTTIPQSANDEEVLAEIRKTVENSGSSAKVDDWAFDMAKLEGFRYRFTDALRSVTRIAIREARTKELRDELIKSEKLRRHFEENPDDLRHLRHDGELTHAVRQQPHLRHVPEYLLPEGGKAAVAKDIGYVGLRKDGVTKFRKGRGFGKTKGKPRSGRGGGRGVDPIRSLNVRGRGKK